MELLNVTVIVNIVIGGMSHRKVRKHMSRSLLHDWECAIERCCRENLYSEMLDIAEDIYNTAYERGKNRESIPYIMNREIGISLLECQNTIEYLRNNCRKQEEKSKVYERIDEDRPLFMEEETKCRLCAEEHRQLVEWMKDYKRLKEQEPCDDCISRQAALDAVNIGNLHPGIVEALQSILAELPPVIPQQNIVNNGTMNITL